MTQWTEQPDGTWRRGPLVVRWDSEFISWFARCGGILIPMPYMERDCLQEAQAAADAWAREMLAQLKELEEPCNKS